MEALFYSILIGFGVVLLVHSVLLIQMLRQVNQLMQPRRLPSRERRKPEGNKPQVSGRYKSSEIPMEYPTEPSASGQDRTRKGRTNR